MWPRVKHTDIIMRKSLHDSGGFLLFFFHVSWLFAAKMEALNHSVTSQHPVEKHLHLMGGGGLSVICHLFVEEFVEHSFVIFSSIATTAQDSNVTVTS